MKDLEILTDMCLKVNSLLLKLYEDGRITKDTYEEHTRLKIHFLENLDIFSSRDEQPIQVSPSADKIR